jgi:hypothetical protein
MIYASTYLLYSSEDIFLAQWTAQELGKRGIITWNKHMGSTSGEDMGEALKEAIQKQAFIIVFISPDAVASPRLKDALTIAFAMDSEMGDSQRIIPIYLGDPVELVSSSQLLRDKWLHPDGNKVKGFNIVSEPDPNNVSRAEKIAEQVAEGIYQLLKIPEQQEVVIYLDQRGEGLRHGEPQNIPDDIKALEVPALVFRPNLSQRRQHETLYGNNWDDLRLTIEWALSKALGGVKWTHPKNIRILGASQLGFPFILGQYFNRNTPANLYCQTTEGKFFNNRQQQRHASLEGGNPNCNTPHPKIKQIPKSTNIKSMSLLLLSGEKFVSDVCHYLKEQKVNSHPMVWVKHDYFKSNKQIMSYISDIVALLKSLTSEHKELSTIYLYCGLPFSVIPLLAANLLHVAGNIIFMEYRRDLQGKGAAAGEIYTPLRTRWGDIDTNQTLNLSVHCPKTKILFLAANPVATPKLQLKEEMEKIQANLKSAKESDDLELKHKAAVSMEILMQALLDEPPEIVHFSGHGVEQGIFLQDEKGFQKIIPGKVLERLFKEFKDKIKCVILNACYTEPQARAIKSVIPIVIGMKEELEDEAAIAFSTGFYKAIGAGKNIPAAFNMGLAAIEVEEPPGKDIAVLL